MNRPPRNPESLAQRQVTAEEETATYCKQRRRRGAHDDSPVDPPQT